MFNSLTIPEALTTEYVEDVIYNRYENRRPCYVTEGEEIDEYEVRRFLSEWNQVLQVKSKVFTNAYDKLLNTVEFLDYKESTLSRSTGVSNTIEDVNSVGGTDNTSTTKNTGTVSNTNDSTNVTTHNTLNTSEGSNTSDSNDYTVHEKLALQAIENYDIESTIKNAESRDVTKNSDITTSTGTSALTGTDSNVLNGSNNTINDLTNTSINTSDSTATEDRTSNTTDTKDDESTRSGYSRPIWEMVDTYVKQVNPWDILWDSLDPLFSTYYKGVF